MKTEVVIRSSYFRAPRRYAQWITKKEGIVKEKLDIKGLEFKKSNFPKIFGVLFKESLIKILKGSKQEEIDKDLQSFKDSMLGGNLTLKELGNPVSVKTLNKYIERKAKNSEVFSKIGKGAPASVKASIIYNDLLKFWKLDKEHSAIVQGDKVKWVYLKPNQFHIEAIAFLDFDLPIKIEEFINKFIDIEKTFDTILLNKLEGMYSDLGWVLNLNKFQKLFFNF
jgi:DNA polymerase elongation subunit (family B)